MNGCTTMWLFLLHPGDLGWLGLLVTLITGALVVLVPFGILLYVATKVLDYRHRHSVKTKLREGDERE